MVGVCAGEVEEVDYRKQCSSTAEERRQVGGASGEIP